VTYVRKRKAGRQADVARTNHRNICFVCLVHDRHPINIDTRAGAIGLRSPSPRVSRINDARVVCLCGLARVNQLCALRKISGNIAAEPAERLWFMAPDTVCVTTRRRHFAY
jgi:hypothetical protein